MNDVIVFRRLDPKLGHQELILETVEQAKEQFDESIRSGYIVSYNGNVIRKREEIGSATGEMTAFKPVSGG